MRPEDLRRYKKLLEEKQLELFTKPDAETLVPAARGWQGDVADDANADAEAELQIRLHESEGRLARAIEDALGRMRRGTYGVCTMCEHPISKPRLEAVPWTHLCRDCKEQKSA
jgi:DnaK suppressor protein